MYGGHHMMMMGGGGGGYPMMMGGGHPMMGHPMMMGGYGGMGGMGGHPMMMGHPGMMGHFGMSGCKYCGEVFPDKETCQATSTQHDSDCPRYPSRSETHDLGTVVLYHQTDEGGATGIRNDSRMRCSSKGAYGPAIYFADSAEATDPKAHYTGWIIKARVRMGKALVCRSSRSSLQERDLADHGCESVYAPKGPQGGFPEYAVFDSSKVDVIEIRRR
jgi:hypothetical protein